MLLLQDDVVCFIGDRKEDGFKVGFSFFAGGLEFEDVVDKSEVGDGSGVLPVAGDVVDPEVVPGFFEEEGFGALEFFFFG